MKKEGGVGGDRGREREECREGSMRFFTFHSPLSSSQMSPCRDTVSLCCLLCVCARHVTLCLLMDTRLSCPCLHFLLCYAISLLEFLFTIWMLSVMCLSELYVCLNVCVHMQMATVLHC